MDTEELKQIDNELVSISRKLSLVTYLDPLNYEEEIQKFKKDVNHNPQFDYPNFIDDNYESRLTKIVTTNTLLGRLFESSKVFLLKSLRAIKNRGTEKFTDKSLYGVPNKR